MTFNEDRAGKTLRATDAQLVKIYLGGSLASSAARLEILARGLPLPKRAAKKT
jgi:hypothetical protein